MGRVIIEVAKARDYCRILKGQKVQKVLKVSNVLKLNVPKVHEILLNSSVVEK